MTTPLHDILVAREQRWNARLRLTAVHRLPVLSLTLNIPGPDKRLPGVGAAFASLRRALRNRLRLEGSSVTEEHLLDSADGLCWLACIDMEATNLKRLAVAVEDGHPLGRLADADVLDAQGSPLSRGQLGRPPRECLLCRRAAAVCRREGRHSLPDLLAAVCERLRAAQVEVEP